jgi:hypothetical protein
MNIIIFDLPCCEMTSGLRCLMSRVIRLDWTIQGKNVGIFI